MANVDVWLKLITRIEGNKLERNILLPKKLSDPGAVLSLFSEIEKLVKKLNSDK